MNTEMEFVAWPKIPRLNRGMVITEKIDGTNAAVIVTDDGRVGAQSRNRLITPEQDNQGFARWVAERAEILSSTLGPGRHFGEWWGSGIQRGYGLTKGEKRLSLFNVKRYADLDLVPGLGLVPVLFEGPFATDTVADVLNALAEKGSSAAPGFGDPEGIVVFLAAAQSMFKVTIKGDDAPKSLAVTA